MKVMKEEVTIQKFIDMVNENELSLEHPLQRSAGLWSNNKRQKFVSSIINGLYIPPFFIVDKTGRYLLDGLQRFTTVKNIIDDEFIFVDDVKLFKNGTTYQISGKKFSEIDKKLQDKILQFNFTMAYMTDATNREIEETFYNLNDGEQMSESIKAKSILGIETAEWLNKIVNNSFFTDKAHLTDKQRKDKDEQTVIYQYTYIFNKQNSIEDLSQAEISLFLRENRNVFTKEYRKEVEDILNYLNSSISETNEKYKKITKTHIPMLMMVAKIAMENNIDIAKFGEWLLQFFKDYKNSKYQNQGCGAGNVKKEKTLVRIELMKEHYNKYMETAVKIQSNVNGNQESQPEHKQDEKQPKEIKEPVKEDTRHNKTQKYISDNEWQEPCRVVPHEAQGAYAGMY